MKKVLSILLAFVMLFSFAACGEDSDTANGENSGANSNQQAEPAKKVNVRYKIEYPYLEMGEDLVHYVTSDGCVYTNGENGKELENNSIVFSSGFVVNSSGISNNTQTFDWSDVVQLVCPEYSSVCIALLKDGTVKGNTIYSTEVFDKSIYRDALEWSDIVAISAGYSHILGLKSDGTVVAAGQNYNSQCDVEGWKDVVAIYTFECGDYDFTRDQHSMAIKSDGTVLWTSGKNNCYFIEEKCSKWTDIVALSAGYGHILGLKSDGTVVSCGNDTYGETKVSDWKDIVAIKAFDGVSVGIKADGSVVSAGDDYLIDTYLKDVKLKVD